MVWNVQIVIGQLDTVPAHLVDQVFPDNDDLLAAVLDPDRKNMAGHFYRSLTSYQIHLMYTKIKYLGTRNNIWTLYVLPARVSSEHRKWHLLSELLCDVICQGRPEENMFIRICPNN